jgi:hypothetical protein
MPIPSCPPEIRQMMTLEIMWEQFLGFDGHGEPLYAPAIPLQCYRESHGISGGGLDTLRTSDVMTLDPDWDFYFSGDDPNARKMRYGDRLTTQGVGAGSTGQKVQIDVINTIIGPPFDNKHPWVIMVTT